MIIRVMLCARCAVFCQAHSVRDLVQTAARRFGSERADGDNHHHIARCYAGEHADNTELAQ
jgi:hypothetical protein